MVPLSQHIIMMGVSGCGKSSIGAALSERLHWVFYDGDDFHSSQNIQKMHSGIALNDEDRQNWLLQQKKHLASLSLRGVYSVLACSALKASYRKILQDITAEDKAYTSYITFLWLDVPFKIAKKRIKKRSHHFMKASLLQSQYDTLEPPSPLDEDIRAHAIDASSDHQKKIVEECMNALALPFSP